MTNAIFLGQTTIYYWHKYPVSDVTVPFFPLIIIIPRHFKWILPAPPPPPQPHKRQFFFSRLENHFLGPNFFFLTYLFNLFIFGCVGSSLLCEGFPLVAASGGYSSLRCAGFSLWWLLLLQSTGSRRTGFRSCSTRASVVWLVGSRAQAQ